MSTRSTWPRLLAVALLAGAASVRTAAGPAAFDPLVSYPAPPRPAELGDRYLNPTLGRWVAPLGDAEAVLTLDAGLQARLERSLAGWTVPWGVVVMMEPSTGRVLALAEHSRVEPARRDLALTALSPAASIFKLVTAAALLEAGVEPQAKVCYHGGKRRLQARLLSDDPRRDRRCSSLFRAFGHSTNTVFAKLAGRDLDGPALREAASRFLFNAEIPFERHVAMSTAQIGDGPLELANAAAGFGEVRLSPLHGALLAATVANGGVLVPPRLVDEVRAGPLGPEAPPRVTPPWRVMDEAVASGIAGMMRATVTEGTARKAFRRVGPALRDVPVAGKTGSLFERAPFRDHSWFVGYAPADRPEVAIAVVVVNERIWRVRAPSLAREALEIYFGTKVARAGWGSPQRLAAR
jgi:cell division protein FtsI/penicillin-binding protein 2